MGDQRGFTLVEVFVAAGIVALIACGVTISLAVRPGALRASVESFDASFAAARAIAAASGNGATMVFVPRAPHGFSLRVYAGRPTTAGAVTLAGVPALVSDADVREATLGAPPFAIFISSAGNASGLAQYPPVAADGTPRFDVVPQQPPCPTGGLALAFSVPHGSQTRVLPCGARAFGSPLPLASATPAAILLTPKALVYDWPSAPAQTFVATEWGYTRWFAADAFVCGDAIALFPASPPYSPPHAPEDASAVPAAPAGVPYSFANAPDSMEDAPARFPLGPAGAGVCTATVSDAYGQDAALPVRVMGALAATPSALSWGRDDSAAKRLTLSKTYDLERLELDVDRSSCDGIVTALVDGTPLVPVDADGTPSRRSVTVTPVAANGYNAGGSCSLKFSSQYAGEPPVTVAIDVAAGAAVSTWPAQVKYAVQGRTFAVGTERCGAQAMQSDGETPDTTPPAWAIALGASTDQNGCYAGSVYSKENSGTPKTWTVSSNECPFDMLQPGSFSSNPGAAVIMSMTAGTRTGSCSLEIDDGSGRPPEPYAGLVGAEVVASDHNTLLNQSQLWSTQVPCHKVGGGGTEFSCNVGRTSPETETFVVPIAPLDASTALTIRITSNDNCTSEKVHCGIYSASLSSPAGLVELPAPTNTDGGFPFIYEISGIGLSPGTYAFTFQVSAVDTCGYCDTRTATGTWTFSASQ